MSQYPKIPDILVITENYLKDEHITPDLFPIPDRTANHRPDVTVYTNSNLNITTITDIEIPNTAVNIVQIHSDSRKTNPIHTVIGVYRRPSTSQKDFITNLQRAIDQIHTKNPTTSITIIGDININLITPTQAIIDLLAENGLTTTITTPTRYDPTHTDTATLIDVILTDLTATTATAGTISPPIADHLAIYTILHMRTAPRKQQHAKKCLSLRRYQQQKRTILAEMKTAVTTARRNTKPGASTSERLRDVQTAIKQTIERHEKRPKPRRKTWRTAKHRRMIKKQHELHRRRIENPTHENIRRHAAYRNKLKKTIRHDKRKHIITEIEEAKRDPKRRAQILKSLNPKGNTNRTSPTTIKYNGHTHTDPTSIANALNDHYITIGEKTTRSIPQERGNGEGSRGEKGRQDQPPPFRLRHTTLAEVTETMKKINPNKANDIYKIKPAVIKDLTPFLAPILTNEFNIAIDESEYPDSLKMTKLIELYKAKDKTLPENYRPISLLPIIAKILDTIINQQLMDHLLKHKLISPTQYAFRPHSNTTLALQTIIGDIHRPKTLQKPTLALYIDLSKAYDTISHKKLFHAMRDEFNFSPSALTFFMSYFNNRRQSTHTQHAQSEMKTITHGIPQGSTLSTTLFLIYNNNIIKAVPASKVYTYADDTTLVITARTVRELQALAQSELNDLINYFYDNNLVPNATKTNFTVFHPITNHQQIQLHINDTYISHCRSAKLLGIYIQDDLRHKQTITNIIRKLQPMIFNFKRATKLLTTKHMKNEYFTHIYPHLITNISIWGTPDPSKTYIQPLIRTQKKIIRLIKNVPPGTHTRPIMNELGILGIHHLYTLRVLSEMHPYIYPPGPTNRPDHYHNYMTVAQVHAHATRLSQQGHHYIPNPYQYSADHAHDHTRSHFTHSYAAIWNTIPMRIKHISVLKTFKRELSRYLLEQQRVVE